MRGYGQTDRPDGGEDRRQRPEIGIDAAQYLQERDIDPIVDGDGYAAELRQIEIVGHGVGVREAGADQVRIGLAGDGADHNFCGRSKTA